ncbi:MAG: FAD-dependent monooxygenase [Clostridia bacterium]|nr:FAD-dependent monooxygenase [Clostridia bacterium]
MEDGIEFSYMIDGKVYTEKTKLLIGADGAFSKVRNEFFSKVKKPKEYAAIQEWYRVEKPDAYYYGFADENVCDFYSWIIPKENYLILGSSIDDMKHANEKFEVLKNDLKRYGFNFTSDNFVKKEGSILFRPTSMRQIALGDGNVALIGEAAGIISPSSSEGIGYAIRCGACMAECLNENLDEGIKKYCKKAKKIARHAVRKKYRSFFLYK